MPRVKSNAGSSNRHGCQAIRREIARARATSGCSGVGLVSLGPVDMRESRFVDAVERGYGTSLVSG